MEPTIREFEPPDVEWATMLLTNEFGGPIVVSRGSVHDATALPGLVALLNGVTVGLVNYHVIDDECEVVSIVGRGVGAALLQAVQRRAAELGCRRMWLVTTNDNTRALRFYQRLGWDLVALHRDSMTAARRLKPAIPAEGCDGIPIRHELELELALR